jgi:copper chaperone CopZ
MKEMKGLKLKINGMMCGGCENRVKNALSEIDGVESVEADHNTGIVVINSKKDLDIAKIKEQIIDIGYEIVEE